MLAIKLLPFLLLFAWEVHSQVANNTGLTPLEIALFFVNTKPQQLTTVGYFSSAAAVLIARDRIASEGLIPNYYLNFTYAFDDCEEDLMAGRGLLMLREKRVVAMIGPTCSSTTELAGVMGKVFNLPVVSWGLATAHRLSDRVRFPTLANMAASSLSLAYAIRRMLSEYNLTEFAYIYSNYMDSEKCEDMRTALQSAVSRNSDVSISLTMEVVDVSNDGYINSLRIASRRARIFVICFAEGHGLKRRFMVTAYRNGFVNDEYLYIFADTKNKGFYVTRNNGTDRLIWDSDTGADDVDDAREAFKTVIALTDADLTKDGQAAYAAFSEEVISRMKDPPFNCVAECKNYTVGSMYAGQLHDSVMFYAHMLNKTMQQHPDQNLLTIAEDGQMLLMNSEVSFKGAAGNIQFNANNTRVITFYMMAVNAQGEPQNFGSININGQVANLTPGYTSISEVFANRKNKAPPLVEPICGFREDSCPVNFVSTYLVWVIVASVLIFLTFGGALSGFFYSMRSKRREMERMNMMWQIPFSHLQAVQKKNKGEQSIRSLSSGPSSTGTKITMENKVETRHYKFFILNNDKVAALKHTTKFRPDDDDASELRQLRQLEHDNMNTFLGLVLDGPEFLSVWRYCGRGSLKDVILKGSITMDYFFVFSLIRDIISGLSYIHKSFLKYHGNLTSETCLVDERFQVKLSYFGLEKMREATTRSNEDMLWSAPEVLKGLIHGSEKADVYSFAIVCSELITKKPAWDLDNRKEPAETIVYWLKRDRGQPPRPELTAHETIDVSSGMLELIKDCWAQDEDKRPAVEQIRALLKGLHNGRNDNLMDHVFNIMETYAATLEEEVSSRTKELVEEKKKSDVLLYRMLPRQVADKLKLGQSVQPETFDSVTVFFSDVVQFTILASKCTPLQVVTLLNDLYNILDNIIEEADVYKVETIGDGYLCVSGLPHRNGNEHAREIACLALSFMDGVRSFRIPHLPSERMNLRIGVHSGSVVAGVVGLTMPRYCLFGDTVNTASRMESNGKAGHIHLSAEANRMMTEVVGGFKTESRGEVIIKGKGVMETFWLLSRTEGENYQPPLQSIIKERKIETPPINFSARSTSEQRSITPKSPRSVTPLGIYSDYKKNGLSTGHQFEIL
ncbi:unnamed protein product [Auanema sp. JU1783]|nr:unnamed protein product [Auanema sp. JU1783]